MCAAFFCLRTGVRNVWCVARLGTQARAFVTPRVPLNTKRSGTGRRGWYKVRPFDSRSRPRERVVVAGDLLVWPVPFVGSDQSHVGDWGATLERLIGLNPLV